MPRPRPCCVTWGPSPPKGHSSPNFLSLFLAFHVLYTVHLCVITAIRVRHSRGENAYWSWLSVCVSVCRQIPTPLHGPGCNLGEL